MWGRISEIPEADGDRAGAFICMQRRFRGVMFGSMTAASLALGVLTLAAGSPPDWRFAVEPVSQTGETPYFETVFDYEVAEGVAHSPAIVTDGSNIRVIWYEGSGEAENDVRIMTSALSFDGARWTATPPRAALDAQAVAAATAPRQLVRKLGNTIGDGAGNYYATIVSLGGWSMASIAHVTVRNGAVETARRLHLSPFLNRSHLVRAPVLAFADGDVALPAYFDVGGAFGELVRISPNGRIRDKARIGWGHIAIQPVIAPLDDRNAVALLRNYDRKGVLYISRTNNGGKSWSAPTPVDGVANPNAPAAALALSNGAILMAFNDAASPARSDLLKLALSSDGGASWRRIETLEDHGGDPREFARYPMMRRLPSGRILLVYSVRSEQGVRAHVFNESWVLSQ